VDERWDLGSRAFDDLREVLKHEPTHHRVLEGPSLIVAWTQVRNIQAPVGRLASASLESNYRGDTNKGASMHRFTKALTRCKSSFALAALAGLLILMVAASTAVAENPLYCSGRFHINEGCGTGTLELQHENEARNEEGGCVAVQWYGVEENGEGFYAPIPAKEVCNGGVAGIYWASGKVTSYPRCWNRSNAYDLIHCRHGY
jgi:hypothetical protein